jgi:Glycosyl transferases group 1
MKILMIGPGIGGLYGGLYYSTDKKIRNGFTRCGHHVVNVPHHDISDSVFGLRAIGVPIADMAAKRVANYLQPDLVVLYLSHLISRNTLQHIKSGLPDAKFINIEVDPLRREGTITRNTGLKGIVDTTFLTSGGRFISRLRDEGLDVAFLPNPTDSSIETDAKDDAADRFEYDLVYISSVPANHERWNLVNDLKALKGGLRIGIFGANKQRILGEDYVKLLRSSRTALNWAAYSDVDLYASSRIAQVFGFGNCVCMANSSGYRRFLGENDAIWFDGHEDLARSLEDVLKTGRDREIARNGQRRYRELFNETRTADYILKRTFGKDVSGFEWSHI